jgi:hypothetical protein
MLSSLQPDSSNEGRNNHLKIPRSTVIVVYFHYVKLQIVPNREQICVDFEGQQVTGRVMAADYCEYTLWAEGIFPECCIRWNIQ